MIIKCKRCKQVFACNNNWEGEIILCEFCDWDGICVAQQWQGEEGDIVLWGICNYCKEVDDDTKKETI